MNEQHQYIIGVDAGGTYTDAVIMDAASGRVIASAKRPTTHYNLSEGITAVLGAVMQDSQIPPQAVALTSISTTLATNALVEGKGADVGLFVIGFNQRLEVPAVAARYIPGGHSIKGEECEPLGVNFVLDGLQELHGQVDAWAVCGSMAFKNPAHELVTAKAIQLAAKLPVFCSHEASMRAGMKERATTACLNAQLLPVMRDFLDGMSRALCSLNIGGSVYVVRGDARAMPMEEALRQAASTVASGPAATALFGSHQSRLQDASIQDALILDVGGTTTDITLIRSGKPVIDEGGMTIGKWETHVEAVEMFTVGVGGDSFVCPVKDGGFSLGPSRVLPLCMAGDLPAPEGWLSHGLNARCILAAPALTEEDKAGDDILRLLAEHGPATPEQIMRSLKLAEITVEQRLAKLARRQKVIETGFTPTDALHVLDMLHLGNADASSAAAALLGAPRQQDARAFARSVLHEAERIIEETVLRHVTRREVGGGLAAFLADRDKHSLITVDVALNVPMIGIGAAARMLLPEVAKRLRTTITFPERHEVGNALGAALMARPLLQGNGTTDSQQV
ncbi:hydantoinase/oxoprolinase family protein [Desulfovibrio mangrovi]|uniref:hydantoinase/oxoprolinase family protein n=1 Tax=Desulfovibrio mangrovi TaxID=2976983 RepID=UPI0022460FF4|nr:hydantoinase/oxoprolinase family protein [Desulfovibrio mangrovi]UZP66309.1 hydantoinase/oxoprolinase family protein [Desulfovibrio mangrovi]